MNVELVKRLHSFTGAPRPDLPRTPAFDETRGLLAEGYDFISNRCDSLRTDVFETRLMLKRFTCLRGQEASRLFYGSGNFSRARATPPIAIRLLQDRWSVQSLEGAAHRVRKAMFLRIVSPERMELLARELEVQWVIAMVVWARDPSVVLYDRVVEVLCRAVCVWAGMPEESDSSGRAGQLEKTTEFAGASGVELAQTFLARWRLERWAREAVELGRTLVPPAPDSALGTILAHRDEDGRPLGDKAAVEELLNVVRPVVAVARYVTFAAHALHVHPDSREALARQSVRAFVHEVRRFYPLVPFVGGRAVRTLPIGEHSLEAGSRVLFDLYGTNHDARIWGDPEEFRPERFAAAPPGAFELVAQGGGRVETGHRCPGENLTILLTERAVSLLTGAMRYDVPPQNLTIPHARARALPLGRMVLTNVRAVG